MTTHIRVVLLTDENTIKAGNVGYQDGNGFIADGAEILGTDPANVIETEVLELKQRSIAVNNLNWPELRESQIAFNQTVGKVAVVMAAAGSLVGMTGGVAEANAGAQTFAVVKVTTV